MTQTEALKLALEALEISDEFVPVQEAIAAIKEALSQPEQEPVAWMDEETKTIFWHNTHETDDYHGFKRTTPLYTTPPQRTWVGLTPFEIDEIIEDAIHPMDALFQTMDKLKEKNT